MYPIRYFCNRFFPGRFFPHYGLTGADVPVSFTYTVLPMSTNFTVSSPALTFTVPRST